jgi:glycosyltransferase involved in cell wall biosynthesis
MSDPELRLLLAGPLPPPLGGTTVVFDALAQDLSARPGIAVEVVDTTGVRGSGIRAPAAFLSLARRVRRAAREADIVSLHVSTSALHLMGPAFVRAARSAGVPLVVRKFGGTDFLGYDPVRRAVILRALAAADLYLAETRALVAAGEAAGLRNVRWLANSRPMPELAAPVPGPCRRFVYVGQIHARKGIRELIAAAEGTGGDLTVDVYGTLGYDVRASELDGLSRVRFRGALDPSRVVDTLSAYDALVLPTYHAGEGYPGVVLEAYAAGLPVVCTRWRALPELVDERSGVLIDPRSADARRSAMERLSQDAALSERLREGVRARRGEFSDERWHGRFVELLREVLRSRADAGEGVWRSR